MLLRLQLGKKLVLRHCHKDAGASPHDDVCGAVRHRNVGLHTAQASHQAACV